MHKFTKLRGYFDIEDTTTNYCGCAQAWRISSLVVAKLVCGL